jgi:hypothetical protein
MKMIEKRSIGGTYFPLRQMPSVRLMNIFTSLMNIILPSRAAMRLWMALRIAWENSCLKDAAGWRSQRAECREVIAILGRPEAIEEETSESDSQDKKNCCSTE